MEANKMNRQDQIAAAGKEYRGKDFLEAFGNNAEQIAERMFSAGAAYADANPRLDHPLVIEMAEALHNYAHEIQVFGVATIMPNKAMRVLAKYRAAVSAVGVKDEN